MKWNVVNSVYFTPRYGNSIGVVAVQYDRYWQAYIGVVTGENDKSYDDLGLAKYGVKITAEQAHGFFPELDINQYKTKKA